MTVPSAWSLPRVSAQFIPVWRRNALVWRKLAIPSMLGNLADPMMYMLAIGYGLGAMLPKIDGVAYIAFLAAGSLAFSVLNSATFEALYSAFSRMYAQRTWDAILNAPVAIEDLVFGELVWAASKATLSGLAILLVATLLGLVENPIALWIIPLIPLVGLTFSALGLIVTAVARSYDFFMYYFTLFVTPMSMLSGVFFPIDQLPAALGVIARCLPLYHAVELIRPLLLGSAPMAIAAHLGVLVAYGAIGFYAGMVLFRRRLAR